ncbi:MAG: nucleoside hydrolase-like domain-containing protein [Ignavibacteriaceae bacterium]
MRAIVYLIGFSLILFYNSILAHADQTNINAQKNRVIILSDIGADPDDSESMIRLLLYSNEIDIEGLIATTSCWQKTTIHPEYIKSIIQAYGKVEPNLNKNEAGFPGAESLLKIVKNGIAEYGMQGVGEGKDSPGSKWIIKVLEEKDERPLWVCAWGGENILAQALYEIKKTKAVTEVKQLIAKLRIYTISDQDDSGVWIRKNFPDLFYIVSPGDDYGSATWSAINSYINGIDNKTISNKWLAENIQQGHGPLGAVYPDVAYGMEGDTPSWLGLTPNGLNFPEHPDWGGWGGRYELYKPDFDSLKKGSSGVPIVPETRPIWTNAADKYTPYVFNEYGRAVRPDTITFTSNKATLWRWRDDFQNDFAARMRWCNESYKEANHPPIVKLLVPEHVTVNSGEGFGLDATAADPDGDNLSYLWFNYPEAGSYKELIKINSAENVHNAYVIAPKVEKKETVQFILRVSDKGTPSLSRYERVFVTIMPK